MLRLLLICGLFSPIIALAASLQEQIDRTPEGGTIELAAGTYQGPLRISHTLTLRGEPGARIVGDGRESVISVHADNVVIEGLHVSGSGRNLEKDHAAISITGAGAQIRGNSIDQSLHGIYLKEARGVTVEGNTIVGQTVLRVPIDDPMAQGLKVEADGMCAVRIDANQRGNGIHLWNSSDNVIRNNQISHTRDGIYFSFSNRTLVEGNTIREVRYGLHYMYSDFNRFEGNLFEGNAAGAAIMYSEGLLVSGNSFSNNAGYRAYGILAQSVDDTTFQDNLLSHNTVGLYLENSNGNTLKGNGVKSNYVGVRLSTSSIHNTFTENRFDANLHPVEMDQGSDRNSWASDGRGNYWGGSQPVDLDGDAVGNLPHRQADLLGRHRREFPLAALLSESPALRLVAFVHSRTRIPGVSAIEDPSPLIP